MWWQKTPHLLAGWDAGEKSLISSCFSFRSRQPYVPSEGPDHPHQGPEAEAPVSGGASGALPAGAQEAVHQRGSKLPSLDLNILFCSLIIHEKHFTCLFFFYSQELTGTLPSDYPLMPDEKPPQVRRRIGASFKLDEGLIHPDNQVGLTVFTVFWEAAWTNWSAKTKSQNLCRM